MSGTIILTELLKLSLVLGFAYIIWILALKETVALKIIGQIIAVAIMVFVIISAVMPRHMFRYGKGGDMGYRNTEMKGQNIRPGMGAGNERGIDRGMHDKGMKIRDHSSEVNPDTK